MHGSQRSCARFESPSREELPDQSRGRQVDPRRPGPTIVRRDRPLALPRRSELRRRAEARQAAARTDNTVPTQYREDGGTLDWGTAKGFDLPGLLGPVAEQLQSTAEDLQLDPVAQAAWKFARKDGGGAVVKVVEDGRRSNEPIDYANLHRVKKLVALDRWELTSTRWGQRGRRRRPARVPGPEQREVAPNARRSDLEPRAPAAPAAQLITSRLAMITRIPGEPRARLRCA